MAARTQERRREVNYVPRMPKVGERWKIHIILGELVCARCKYITGSKAVELGWQDKEVTVLSAVSTITSHCPLCGYVTKDRNYVSIDLHIPYDTLKIPNIACIPYTWLEPVEVKP